MFTEKEAIIVVYIFLYKDKSKHSTLKKTTKKSLLKEIIVKEIIV